MRSATSTGIPSIGYIQPEEEKSIDTRSRKDKRIARRQEAAEKQAAKLLAAEREKEAQKFLLQPSSTKDAFISGASSPARLQPHTASETALVKRGVNELQGRRLADIPPEELVARIMNQLVKKARSATKIEAMTLGDSAPGSGNSTPSSAFSSVHASQVATPISPFQHLELSPLGSEFQSIHASALPSRKISPARSPFKQDTTSLPTK